MLISVIIATYNKPHHLDRVLTGYGQQNDRNFEIIIADDGSGKAVQTVIDKHKSRSPLDIKHYWQADDGFRKCAALNATTPMARGEYILFTDDDCVPAPNFVKMHRYHAEPDRYLVAHCNRLPQTVTDTISLEDIENRKAFKFLYLARRGYLPTTGFIRLLFPEWAGRMLDSRTSDSPVGFLGGTSSVFKRDVLKVGGFNELMGYGLEDTEFGQRLMNAGVRPKRIKNSTYALHLEHERVYATAESINRNREILRHVLEKPFTPANNEYPQSPNHGGLDTGIG